MIPYVDFHTHDLSWDETIFRLNSLSLNDFKKNISVSHLKNMSDLKNPFTVGIHPWDVDVVDINHCDELWSEMLNHELCVGLGEIGLDKARPKSYQRQFEVFVDQVRRAKELGISWLVLHCVRAQNDVLKVLKDESFKGRAVFHDYNGSFEEGKRLLDLGYVVSLGSKILNPKTKAYQWLQQGLLSSSQIPWGQFFLETDDSSISVVDLYEGISQWTHFPIDELKAQFFTHLPTEFRK